MHKAIWLAILLVGMLFLMPIHASASFVRDYPKLSSTSIDAGQSIIIYVQSSISEKWTIEITDPSSSKYVWTSEGTSREKTQLVQQEFPKDWLIKHPSANTYRLGTYEVKVMGTESGGAISRFTVNPKTSTDKAVNSILSEIDELKNKLMQIKREMESLREIDTTNLVDKNIFATKISELENKIDMLNP